MRKQISDFLEGIFPPTLWSWIWWFIPISAIVFLPFGLIFTVALGQIGFEAVGRLNQILILFSLFYGVVGGLFVLCFIDFAQKSLNSINKIKWLARFAVVTPLLIVLTLFLVFRNT